MDYVFYLLYQGLNSSVTTLERFYSIVTLDPALIPWEKKVMDNLQPIAFTLQRGESSVTLGSKPMPFILLYFPSFESPLCSPFFHLTSFPTFFPFGGVFMWSNHCAPFELVWDETNGTTCLGPS